ncbi:restriction endonuclease subunit S [Paenibacillus sp. JSM ZJ436]|uniref:restriction endonuclease subunit S n=1 Tax=Paenibacillus sp. JSM ZJ436 TaxID=3376190 RepID=UPI0037A7757C
MNGQDLKNSILQLAIQGKLVEQRQEEGTAKELLEQIRAEKQRLVNEGKIKREKPLPEITEDEIPFDIPVSWEWIRIGDVFNLQAGKNITAANISDDKSEEFVFPCYGGNGLRGYVQNFNREGTYALIGRQGALCGNINFAYGKFYATEHAVLVDCFGLTDAMWSGYFLRALNLNQYATATAQPGLAVSNIVKLPIPLPPLEEQKRIVAKIEELLPYVDQYDDAHAKVEEFNKKFPEEMQKSILHYAIKGKLVEQRQDEGTAEELYQQIQAEKARLVKEGKIKREKPLPAITEDEIPFDIPESWKWVRLGEIGMTNIGLTYKPTDITNEGTIVLRSSNIQDGQLDYNDLVKVSCTIPDNKMCQTGDILICARNGSKRLVGKAAMIDKGGMSFGAFMAIYRSVCNEYILYIINSAYFRNSMLPETGTTTINQITQETLRHCIIPLPPIEEQKRIVVKIEELMPYTKQLAK